MKNRIILSVAMAMLIGLAMLPVRRLVGQEPPASQNHIPGHHHEYSFMLGPGQSFSFTLPGEGTQKPVRIDVSIDPAYHPAQGTSWIMYATVARVLSTGFMTWIGTNSDGTPRAGYSNSGALIACVNSGAGACFVASLQEDTLVPGIVKVVQPVNAG